MKVLALVLLLSVAYAKHEEYSGWKSYHVGAQTLEQLQRLGNLASELELDFLSNPTVSREGLVLVQPQHQQAFIKQIEDLGITYRVHSEDVAEALKYDDELIAATEKENLARGSPRIPFDNYQRLAVYDAYLEDIARRHPNRVTLVNAANSFQGRPIKYLKISTTNFQDTSKPVIFIDGGIHSREWVSPPSVAWAVNKLVEDVTEPDLLQRFDWILLPIVNPDGYEFSHTNTRFWRKTRSTASSSVCPGVDGNRNYDFHWNSVGSSSNPCADNFAGSSSFSEIETRVVRDILNENLSRLALYLTMHSYGSMILYPWGHDGSLSNNALALHSVGIAMADAIHANAISYFPRYLVGNSVLVIGYPAAGASEDYAHAIGVPLSFTYELPGLSGGFEGFNLEPRYIAQVCRETWAGIVAGARRAGDLWVPLP